MSQVTTTAPASTATEEAPETTGTEEVLETSEESTEETPEVAVQEAPKVTKKVETAIKKELKKLKIKYNGKEEQVEFDPNDEEYMAKQFQMAKLGQSKAKEYSDLEKSVQEFINTLKTNPRAILSDPSIGIDIKKLAADIIDEEIQNSQKSPEQLKAEQLEKELKSLKDEQKRKESEYQQKEFERIQERAYEQYENQIDQALSTADFPKNAYTIKKMADYMLLGLQQGIDVTAEDVVPLVRQEIQEDIKQMFGVMPDEMIEQMVGKETIGRLRKKTVAKAKQAPPSTKVKDVGKQVVKKEEPIKKKTIRELWGI